MTNRYRELFEAELDANGISWCQGERRRSPGSAAWKQEPCDARRSRGARHSPSGGAWATEVPRGPTIHMGREVHTAYGLQIALHEVGHIALGHTELTASGRRRNRQRVFEREAAAEAWSFSRMEELGVPVPENARQRAERYVAYRKRRGDRVIAARTQPRRNGSDRPRLRDVLAMSKSTRAQ
jgi:hypothetical protein